MLVWPNVLGGRMIPQGVPHTLGGGVSLSPGALQDAFIPYSQGRLGVCGLQSWRKREFFFALLSIVPLVEETHHFTLIRCCPALKESLCADSCHAACDVDVDISWDPWLIP